MTKEKMVLLYFHRSVVATWTKISSCFSTPWTKLIKVKWDLLRSAAFAPQCKILSDPLWCHNLSYPHAYETRICFIAPSPSPVPTTCFSQPWDPSAETPWHQLGDGSYSRASYPGTCILLSHKALGEAGICPWTSLVNLSDSPSCSHSSSLSYREQSCPPKLGQCILSTCKHSYLLYPEQWIRDFTAYCCTSTCALSLKHSFESIQLLSSFQ